MNLSPEWLQPLGKSGWQAIHWSAVGSANAPDSDLLAWAKEHASVLLTQDLDFADLLFRARTNAPSVVLLRLRNELAPAQQERVCALLKTACVALERGAPLAIDERRGRSRRLPIDFGEEA